MNVRHSGISDVTDTRRTGDAFSNLRSKDLTTFRTETVILLNHDSTIGTVEFDRFFGFIRNSVYDSGVLLERLT